MNQNGRMQYTTRKPFCNAKRAIIVSVISVLVIIIVIVAVVLSSKKTPDKYLLKMEQWEIADAAFAVGSEALLFRGNNTESGAVGAVKVYLDVADSHAVFQMEDGQLISMNLFFRYDRTTGITLPRRQASIPYKEEVNALRVADGCPGVIPFIGHHPNANLRNGTTFKDGRQAPLVITKYMAGGSLGDLVVSTSRFQLNLHMIRQWNKQMIEAAECVGKRGLLFSDRNVKNFVMNEMRENVFVIDIEMNMFMFERRKQFDFSTENVEAIRNMWVESVKRSRNEKYCLIHQSVNGLFGREIHATESELKEFLGVNHCEIVDRLVVMRDA